jgi:hexosaminidase
VYGGYYSQEDVREVVTHAHARGVTIVPEIELPGHCTAALAAYPELSCTGQPLAVASRRGVFEDVYCAGSDAAIDWLQRVLTEVVDLFPHSPFIHIGADECPKTRWAACPKCQARIRTEGLRDERQLQSWFVGRIARFLADTGRTVVGWDELLQGGADRLPAGAVVQAWRAHKFAAEAVAAGHRTVVSPTTHCYFDASIERIDVRKVYAFDPIPPARAPTAAATAATTGSAATAGGDAKLPAAAPASAAPAADAKAPAGSTAPSAASLVLGGECCMWTEDTPQYRVDSQVFPRACALAEVLWTGPDRCGDTQFEAFEQRMQTHCQRLSAMGVTFGPFRDTSAPPITAAKK